MRHGFTEYLRNLHDFMTRQIPYAACEHCTGLCENAIRYPAAIQKQKEFD